MRVTVCQLHDDASEFARDWDRLAEHVRAEASDWVLLPEMPFCPWFGAAREFDPAVWQAVVGAHEAWLARLPDLAPARVLGTRPVNDGDRRFNEGFAWEPGRGYRALHRKVYLPDQEGTWEASWYHRADRRFHSAYVGGTRVGFLICTELWFLEWARAYGRAGAHLIVTPRATGPESVDKWLAGGRVAAVVSGAFSLSSNRDGADFGGQGWVIGPDGDVLALTSAERPFATVEIDLGDAEQARTTYPRNVPE